MNVDAINRFKKLFESQRDEILGHTHIIQEEFSVSPDDRYDEVDQACLDMEQSMKMHLKNREYLYIKKIEEALKRIEEGTFGLCSECSEYIELKRLEARPTATLCVTCKEEQERHEVRMAQLNEHKKHGPSFSRRYASYC